MKAVVRTIALAVLTSVGAGGAVPSETLGAREARAKIAEALGLDKPDKVHIKSIGGAVAADTVVEADFGAAFHFTKDGSGKWVPVEVRTGDKQWESIELIRTAIRKEKILRTSNEMRSVGKALEAFRRERGFFVTANSCAALIDNLAPAYLKSVIRLDFWSNEFDYQGSAAGYRLASRGPDGKPGTNDDIVIENGEFVKGVSE